MLYIGDEISRKLAYVQRKHGQPKKNAFIEFFEFLSTQKPYEFISSDPILIKKIKMYFVHNYVSLHLETTQKAIALKNIFWIHEQ